LLANHIRNFDKDENQRGLAPRFGFFQPPGLEAPAFPAGSVGELPRGKVGHCQRSDGQWEDVFAANTGFDSANQSDIGKSG
jgi:hypothetical protein